MDDVSVIVVNYNAGPMLAECIEALHRQTQLPSHIIVVDNASEDGSIQSIRDRFPSTSIMEQNMNTGFAAANNLAVGAAKTKWVALLNPDAIPHPNWLTELLRAAGNYPEYSFFASRLIDAKRQDILDGAGDAYHMSGMVWRCGHGKPAKGNFEKMREVFSPCAAAALYLRDSFLKAGGFDEDYFCYSEDVDLGFRLRLLGYRCLYVPSAIAYHIGSAITGEKSDFSLYHGHRNLVWTFFKDMPMPLLLTFTPVHLLLNLVSLLWFSFVIQKSRVIFKAKRDALRGLPTVLRKRRIIQGRRRVHFKALLGVMTKGLPRLPRRG